MQYNKVMLAGNLTKDPETRDQYDVTNFSIAVNRRWKSKDGEWKEDVMFISCSAWGNVGRAIAKHFQRGKSIFVEGHLRFDQWEKDGVKHSRHSVFVESFRFVGPKGEAPLRRSGDDDVDYDDVPF